MDDREDLVYQAKLAEQAERYDGKERAAFLPPSVSLIGRRAERMEARQNGGRCDEGRRAQRRGRPGGGGLISRSGSEAGLGSVGEGETDTGGGALRRKGGGQEERRLQNGDRRVGRDPGGGGVQAGGWRGPQSRA